MMDIGLCQSPPALHSQFDLKSQNEVFLDIHPIAEEAVNNLWSLDEFYEKADVEGKRYLLVMLYTEKWTFDGAMY